MGFWVARRAKRLWSEEEKRSICVQTEAPEVSVAQVARRYALNANLIFKWLRDARYAPGQAQAAADTPCFLPVEIVEHARPKESRPVKSNSLLEFELAGGHRLRISGCQFTS
jgi:transposase